MNPRTTVPSLLLAAVLTGCSAGTDAGSDTVQPAPDPVTSAAATTAPAAPEPSPRAAARLIEVSYEAGQITTAEPRVEVSRGDEVALRITSDVAEEVHVHGFDLVFDVPAGRTVEKTFVADLPGQWEVELHKAHRPMLVLKVA